MIIFFSVHVCTCIDRQWINGYEVVTQYLLNAPFTLQCIFIAFDIGRMLTNMDLSRDFMGIVMDGLMDLGTHIGHPPHIFLQGQMIPQRERVWHRDWPGLKEPGDIELTL